jgi:hypothetical protein
MENKIIDWGNIINETQKSLIALEAQYPPGKHRAGIYHKRFTQLSDKLGHYKNKLLNLGISNNIVVIAWKVEQEEKIMEYQTYFTSITMQEARVLIRYKYGHSPFNIKVKEVQPGILNLVNVQKNRD